MRRTYTVTWVFTLLSIALCFLHYFGYDPRNLLLFSFSVPLWFMPIFGNIRTFHLFFVYLLTVASWAVMGYIVDRLYNRYLDRRRHAEK